MATASDIISDAGRRAGILAGEEAWPAADMADALTRLNDMMHGFGPLGIKYAHTTLALTTTVNIPDELIDSLKWMMVGALADGDYDVQLSPKKEGQIVNAKNQLQAAYWVQPPADTEPVLRAPPGRYDIRTDN